MSEHGRVILYDNNNFRVVSKNIDPLITNLAKKYQPTKEEIAFKKTIYSTGSNNHLKTDKLQRVLVGDRSPSKSPSNPVAVSIQIQNNNCCVIA